MQVHDLDGNISRWEYRRGREVTTDHRPTSALHRTARTLLKERFPTQLVLEEVPIKVETRKTLYLDFYVPMLRLAVEVQGEQHYKLSSQFHATASEFLKQKKHDQMKQDWCDLNAIELLILPYDTVDEWEI